MANESAEKTLQEELQHAIRHDHLVINRLISSRMPLCLPPKTDSPLRFALGLTVYAHLYTSFEVAWEIALSQASKSPAYLSDLETPGLSRRPRLSRDIHALSQLVAPSGAKRMQKFQQQTAHFHHTIFHRCQDKPHLILAWAWTMYLAIFNGGRFIRAGLEAAGDDFWGTKDYPLEFWNFDGKDDGENIHNAFKENFDRAAKRLTRKQKDETVAEARHVFHVVEDVIHVLDKKVGQDEVIAILASCVAASSPLMAVRAIMGLFSRGWRAVVRLWTAWRRPVMLTRETVVLEKA